MIYSTEDLDRIPEHCRESLHSYIEHGTRPDIYLFPILINDLFLTRRFAGSTNWENIDEYIAFLTQHAPPNCFGSRVKVETWIEDAIERRTLRAINDKLLAVAKESIALADSNCVTLPDGTKNRTAECQAVYDRTISAIAATEERMK